MITLLTLGQAAKQTGVSKPTLSKAVSTGKLSATRREDGSWAIEPGELQRYHEANKHRMRSATPEPLSVATPAEPIGNAVEVAELRARAQLAEERLSDLKAALAEMREQRDSWQAQASRLALAPPIADSVPRSTGIMGWLRRA